MAETEKSSDLHERIEIEVKVLILFVMRRLTEPVTIEILTELLCDDSISYFDVTDCVSKLVKTKHISKEGKKYSLTEKGIRNGELLEKEIPYSVRTKAEEATVPIHAVLKRNSMIKTQRSTGSNGGFTVALSLSDGIGEILSMNLYAANQLQADWIEKGFRKNAEKIYHAIIEMTME